MVQGAFCFGEAKGNFEPRMARMDTNVEGHGVDVPGYRGNGVNAPDYRGGIQRLDYGGGEIRFNGKFLLPELKALI